MAQFGTVITNIGLAKIANAQITQETVGIKHMVLGDGNGAYYTLAQSQTSLKREVWRGMIADEQRDPSNPNRIAFSAYIPSTAGGFTIREVGLLDTAGNLIAVSLYPEQYKPQLAEGVSDDLLLHFVLETSNASVVTLAVDPTIVIASRKYVDDKVAGAIGNVGTNLTELQGQVTTHLADDASITKKGHVQLSSAVTSADETKAATSKAVKTAMDRADAAFTQANNGKMDIASVIGAPASTDNTFAQLKTHIQDAKDTLAINLVNKNIEASNTDALSSLASKLAGIESFVLEVGEQILISSTTQSTLKSSGYYSKHKEAIIHAKGIVRVSFLLGSSSFENTAYGKVYINGKPVGIERRVQPNSSSTFTEDFQVKKGDLVQIYTYGSANKSGYLTLVYLRVAPNSTAYFTLE